MKYKVNFKTLSKRQKVEYIWDYYRWHIVVIIIGSTILVSSIYKAVTHRDPLLSVIMLNSYSSETSLNNEGFEDFFKEYNYDIFEEALEIKKNLYFYGEVESKYQDYQTYEILLALLQRGNFELFFGTGDLYLEFLNQGCFEDLSKMLTEEFLKKYKEQIIYFDNVENDEKIPVAFVIKDNKWLIENGYYNEECYLGILKRADTPDIAAEFIEYLLTY